MIAVVNEDNIRKNQAKRSLKCLIVAILCMLTSPVGFLLAMAMGISGWDAIGVIYLVFLMFSAISLGFMVTSFVNGLRCADNYRWVLLWVIPQWLLLMYAALGLTLVWHPLGSHNKNIVLGALMAFLVFVWFMRWVIKHVFQCVDVTEDSDRMLA